MRITLLTEQVPLTAKVMQPVNAMMTDIPAGPDLMPTPSMPVDLAAVIGGWPRRIELSLDDDPCAVPQARARAREILMDWGLFAQTDDTLLVISELVTNALQSSGGRGGDKRPIHLWLIANSTGVVILVQDATHNAPQHAEAGLYDENGRGLMIVQALSAL